MTQNDFVGKSFKIYFFKGTEKTREFEACFVNKGDFMERQRIEGSYLILKSRLGCPNDVEIFDFFQIFFFLFFEIFLSTAAQEVFALLIATLSLFSKNHRNISKNAKLNSILIQKSHK